MVKGLHSVSQKVLLMVMVFVKVLLKAFVM
jgi:hypothetical protein